MASHKKRDKDSLKNLAFSASDDEIFGAAPEDDSTELAGLDDAADEDAGPGDGAKAEVAKAGADQPDSAAP